MIDIKDENKRRAKFRQVLKSLDKEDISNNTVLRGQIYTDIIYIYTGNSKNVDFHHYYSDIFSTLNEIKNSGKEIELIGANLQALYEFSTAKGDTNIRECIRKLLDHTNLELARINYVSTIDDKIINASDIENSINGVGVRVAEQEEKVEKLERSTDSAYSNYISILGIFSAIVLVFFGGTTIFSNVISGMHETPVEKSILICVLTGIVVYDIIFMFIYFLSKLLDRSISATSESVWWQNIVVRFRLRYPIVFYCNMIAGIVLLICGVVIIVRKILEIRIERKTLFSVLQSYVVMLYKDNSMVINLLCILFIFDLLFTVAYVIAKVMDVNIGTVIALKNRYGYWWDMENGQYIVYRAGDETKRFSKEKEAMKYVRRAGKRESAYAYVVNFFKRALFRYPYFSIVNIAIIGWIVFIC